MDCEKFCEDAVAQMREKISGKAIIACSGGVDSTIAAKLAMRAVGDNLLGVFVDTGYMRKGEPGWVDNLLNELGINHKIVDASAEFYEAMAGVSDPEKKRKVIGEKFIRVFEREAKEFGAECLVQGTIAPDWIESGGELRDTIKSHHNVGGLPEKMGMTLVEPLYDLYKDEVREVARHLEISVAERQPFPGPGLAIRVIGEATPEKTEIVREACAIVEEELEAAAERGEMEIPWQYFAVLLPVKTVGVHGDVRAYGYTLAIRAVASLDAMTATYSKVPHPVLEKISIRITNELKNINRITYDITHKPPSTIEWE